jgi:hypothetical protein
MKICWRNLLEEMSVFFFFSFKMDWEDGAAFQRMCRPTVPPPSADSNEPAVHSKHSTDFYFNFVFQKIIFCNFREKNSMKFGRCGGIFGIFLLSSSRVHSSDRFVIAGQKDRTVRSISWILTGRRFWSIPSIRSSLTQRQQKHGDAPHTK